MESNQPPKVEMPVETKIEVPVEVAVQVKISEYDKLIAETEARLYEIKKQKASFIHDQNMILIKNKYKKPA